MKKAASIFLRPEIRTCDVTQLIRWMENPHITRYLNEDEEIADELFKQYGVKVEKRRIDVANIRNAGDFTVSVWLYAGITAEMTAKVEVG